VSFEERSVASLRDLQQRGAALSRVVLFHYTTSIKPEISGESLRAANLETMRGFARSLTGEDPEVVPLEPYSFRAGAKIVESVDVRACDQVLIDISCLTKVHAIAIATVLGRMQDSTLRARLVYTVPENYPGIPSSADAQSWSDIIVAPLSETARFFNENSGRGIVLVGHESARPIVGLSEIEPAGGRIVLTWSRRRPDLGEMSFRKNHQVIRQLEAMRVADWRHVWLELCNFETLAKLVAEEVGRASKQEAPVIMFPYGPKPHVFGIAYELARCYFENSWFVYPVPTSYDAYYSEGIEEVVWFQISKPDPAG